MRIPRFLAIPIIVLAAAAAGVAAFANPAHWAREWPQTDFTRTVIDLDDVMSGGPPKDGIPAIWAPAHIPVA